jgi:small subunit ribosomal protein S2
LEHTLTHLRRALQVTRAISAAGGNVVFVGTRPMLHRVAVDAALQGGAFFVTHWIGGAITNRERVLRHSVGYDPEKITQQYIPQAGQGESEGAAAAAAEVAHKQQPYVHTPDLLILLDMPNNIWAVREANLKHIPIIAVCDTDCDPNMVQYPIPANDDALSAVGLIAGVLSRACREGLAQRELYGGRNAGRSRA